MECFELEDISEALKRLPWLILSALWSFLSLPIRLPFLLLRNFEARTFQRAHREIRRVRANIRSAVDAFLVEYVGERTRRIAITVAISGGYTILLVYVALLSFPGIFCVFVVVLMSVANVKTNFDDIFNIRGNNGRRIEDLNHGF